jgi:hypothetical protein
MASIDQPIAGDRAALDLIARRTRNL